MSLKNNALVSIYNKHISGNLEFAGTGFFINNYGFFITAAHVLNYCSCCYAAVGNDKGNLHEVEVVAIEYLNPNYVDCTKDTAVYLDIAICKINLDNTDYFKLNAKKLVGNERVLFAGFAPRINSQAHNAEVDEEAFNGKVVFNEFAKFNGCYTRFTNCFAFQASPSKNRTSPVKGMSGGPILISGMDSIDEDYEVVGIFFMSETKMPNPLAYGISSTYILTKLEEGFGTSEFTISGKVITDKGPFFK